jgi:hypothetical protein
MSKPIFRITNSINPRVFMSTPIAAASRHGIPIILAAIIEPPNFPVIAIMNINPQ